MIDFTDEGVLDWADWVLDRHPEMLPSKNFSASDILHAALEFEKKRETDRQLQADYLSNTIIKKPNTPNPTDGPIDWDAWYLYYGLCLRSGHKINYDDIAILTDRSPNTVHREFSALKERPTINYSK